MGLCVLQVYKYRVEDTAAIWLLVFCSLYPCLYVCGVGNGCEKWLDPNFFTWLLGDLIRIIRCHLINQDKC